MNSISSIKNTFRSMGMRYGSTLGFLLVYLIFIPYPFFVALMNPVPSEEDLTHVTVRILHASQMHPNLLVQMSDGSTRTFDFAEDLFLPGSGLFGHLRFLGLQKDEISQLADQKVALSVVKVKWTDRWQVWALQSKDINYPYLKAVRFHERHGHFNWVNRVFHIIMIFAFVFIYRLEKRKIQ